MPWRRVAGRSPCLSQLAGTGDGLRRRGDNPHNPNPRASHWPRPIAFRCWAPSTQWQSPELRPPKGSRAHNPMERIAIRGGHVLFFLLLCVVVFCCCVVFVGGSPNAAPFGALPRRRPEISPGRPGVRRRLNNSENSDHRKALVFPGRFTKGEMGCKGRCGIPH